MANRFFNQYQGTLEKGVVTLYARIAVGASGAPTLQNWDSPSSSYKTAGTGGARGFLSITRNSAGNYSLVTQDKYVRFIDFAVNFVVATVPAAPVISLVTFNSTTPLVRFVTSTGGVATDPASGEFMHICLTAQNSNTPS